MYNVYDHRFDTNFIAQPIESFNTAEEAIDFVQNYVAEEAFIAWVESGKDIPLDRHEEIIYEQIHIKKEE